MIECPEEVIRKARCAGKRGDSEEAFALYERAILALRRTGPRAEEARIERHDRFFALDFAGQRAWIPVTKGARYLIELLSHPGKEIHALDLAAAGAGHDSPTLRDPTSHAESRLGERARVNVTRSLRAALVRVRREHPRLGEHLSAAIRTGAWMVYRPDPHHPVEWKRVDAGS